MRLKLNRTLQAALIAAISTVGFTLTQAQATDSGAITLHVSSTPGWSTGDDAKTVYSYLNSTFNEGGTLTFTMNVTWDGQSCGHYQELLHVGMKGTGFYISANGSKNLLVGPATDHGSSHELSAQTLTANTLTTITVTLTNKEEGKATTQISLGGDTYSLADLTWSSMNWNSSQSERDKYSIGCGGSGWSSEFKMEHLTIEGNNITATYTAPAPAESLVWAGTPSSSVWDTQTENWKNGSTPSAFTAGQNAIFDNTAEAKGVTLGENITTGSVTVNGAAYTLALNSHTLTAGTLAVTGEGASLTLTGSGSMTLTKQTDVTALSLVTVGEGSTLALTAGDKSVINLHAGSTGTLEVKGGSVSYHSNLGGATLQLDAGTTFYFDNASGDTTHTYTGNIALGGNVDIQVYGVSQHPNGVTINGNISGSGKNLTKKDLGNLTINGNVVLGALEVQNGNVTINGNSAETSTIGSIKAAQGKTIELTNVTATTINQEGRGDGGYVGNLVIGNGAVVLPGRTDGWGFERTNTLTVKTGGKLDMQTTRWTFQSTNTIELAGGEITGQGDATYGALDFNGSNTVKVTEDSTLSASLRLRSQPVTIEVAEGKNLDFTGNIVNQGNGGITKTGAGMLTMSGTISSSSPIVLSAGTLKVAGDGALGTAGTVTQSGGVLEIATTVDLGTRFSQTGGHISVLENGSLTLGGASLAGTTSVAATGTLVLNGTYEIGDIAPRDAHTTYSDGERDGNGYQTTTGNIVVYEGDGTVTDQAAYTYKGGEVTLTKGVYALPGEADTSTYYINAGTDSYSWIDTNKKAELTGGIVVKSGATLKVDKDINMSTVAATSAGTVQIDSGKVATASAGRHVTLTGDGTYALASGTQVLGDVALGEAWEGTVRLSGNIENIKFDSSVLGDHVEVCGVSGYFYDLTIGGHGTYDGTLTLTNPDADTPALLINNGYSRDNAYYELSGTVDGNGTWRFSKNDSTVTNRIIFSGDTANWDGAIELTKGYSLELTFAQTDGEMGAAITRSGGTLNMIVGSEDGQSTTFIQQVTASALTINAGATATFAGVGTTNTLGSLAGSGTLVVNEGVTLKVTGSVGTDIAIEAKDGAVIDSDNVNPVQVGIAADATATFAQGITDASGVKFSKEGGVEVKNTNEAGGESIHYGIDKENAKVTADDLVYTEAVADTVVANEVIVNSVQNLDYDNHKLTLTHIDTETLQSVGAYMGDVTLQNVGTDAIVLKDITLLGTTVAVYTDGADSAEGSVTITDTLTAGGGTLLANLTIVGNEQGTTTWTLLGQYMTLGSEFTMDTTKSLVNLDITTLRALDNLELGESLILVKALDETTLTYGEEYNGTWFGQMFNRTDALQGDFQVFSTEQGFGLTKVSNTPEPTTGTLSLLALMALAARRRRK